MENKRIAIFLGHPAHFHLFKNTVKYLQQDGYHVDFLVKRKDILEELVIKAKYNFYIIRKQERKNTSKLFLILSVLRMNWHTWIYFLRKKPKLYIGTTSGSDMLGIPSIVCNEDDATVVPLFAKITYPTANTILTPLVCDNGKWNSKSIKYNSYHELAYLHPNHFTPDFSIVQRYLATDKPYFIIRFAKLSAHHDSGMKGIDNEIANQIIQMLKPHGNIYITSERALGPQFEPYRMHIDPIDMHHVMAFADIYIGDSQTMAAEAGVLGVPFIRYNDFVGRIGYLRELEDNYNLGFGIKSGQEEVLMQTLKNLLHMSNRKEVFQERRKKMLDDKIDYAKFLTWFIENFPKSKQIMKDNPEYQYNFK